MNSYFTIPKPCNEDWNAMLPEEQGKHCLKCCKTVIDFTGWEVTAIAEYLKANAGEKVCGRFHARQLDSQRIGEVMVLLDKIYYSTLPALKKMAAIVILMFSLIISSCNDEVMGKATKTEVDAVIMGEALPEPAEINPSTFSIKDTTGKKSTKRKLKKLNVLLNLCLKKILVKYLWVMWKLKAGYQTIEGNCRCKENCRCHLHLVTFTLQRCKESKVIFLIFMNLLFQIQVLHENTFLSASSIGWSSHDYTVGYKCPVKSHY